MASRLFFGGPALVIKLIASIFILLLTACSTRSDLAPVSDLAPWHPRQTKKIHIVRRGETLYSIAFEADVDYRQLAQLNHIGPSYALRAGQTINLQGLAKKQLPRHNLQSSLKPKLTPRNSSPPQIHAYTSWHWPVTGRITTYFLPQQGKKGIDIASKQGAKVYSAGGGTVAYAGNGLAGYGNLIIIKHNHGYLTAYGNNRRNLVVEGQLIKVGQPIAEVGMINHKYWGLHFEIRKAGMPVNPLNYLPKK
jgi:lipoprotein NlpD